MPIPAMAVPAVMRRQSRCASRAASSARSVSGVTCFAVLGGLTDCVRDRIQLPSQPLYPLEPHSSPCGDDERLCEPGRSSDFVARRGTGAVGFRLRRLAPRPPGGAPPPGARLA